MGEKMQLVTFSVKDTGIGIGEEALSQLFKPFSQVNNTAYAEIRCALVWALSICKKLVEMMNGRDLGGKQGGRRINIQL